MDESISTAGAALRGHRAAARRYGSSCRRTHIEAAHTDAQRSRRIAEAIVAEIRRTCIDNTGRINVNRRSVDAAGSRCIDVRRVVQLYTADIIAREQPTPHRVVAALYSICGHHRIRRTVVTGSTARRDKHLTRHDAEMPIDVSDGIVRIRPRGEVRPARLCPKAARSCICRGARRRVNRLRYIVDGVTIDESRRCGSCSDVDLHSVVDIARCTIVCTIGALLVTRRNGQGTRCNGQCTACRCDVIVRGVAAAARRKRCILDLHCIAADTRTLRDGIAAAVNRSDRIICKAVACCKRPHIGRRRNCHGIVCSTVDARAARRSEVDVTRFDRQFSRRILELVVIGRKRTASQANGVLARMDGSLRVACCLRRVCDRGIGNSPRNARCCRGLSVHEICERNAVHSGVIVRIAVIIDCLRLARNRYFTRHNAVVDRNLVVEVVVSLIGDLLIGNRGI